MKSIVPIILALCFAGIFSPLHAQTDSVPELLPLLRTLNAEQGQKVLDYAHHLGAYYGKPLEKTCLMLDGKNQNRVLQYVRLLKDPHPPAPTTVHWNFDTLRFAPIEEGSIMMDSFVVTNTGTTPYVIREAKGGCDCTVLNVPKFPIMPGDSEVIRIEFDAINKAGHATPGMVLYDNSRPNRRTILYLDGDITPKGKVKVIVRE